MKEVMRVVNFIVVAILLSCHNSEPVGSKSIHIDKSIIIERLGKKEFGLTTKELCYLNPVLDSLVQRRSVQTKKYDSFIISQIPLAYLNLQLTILEIDTFSFLFTSQVENELIEFHNENWNVNVNEFQFDNLTWMSDFKELERLAILWKQRNITPDIHEIIPMLFLANTFFYDPFTSSLVPVSNSKGQSWISERRNQKQLGIDLSDDFHYYQLAELGMLVVSFRDDLFSVSLAKSVLPGGSSIVSTYDFGPFYLSECD